MKLRMVAGVLGVALAAFRAAGGDIPAVTVFMFFGNPAPAVQPAVDTDGDGLADGWEAANGLSPQLADDAPLDHDGDGLDARQESQAGSDPWQMDSDGDGIADGADPAPTVAAGAVDGGEERPQVADVVNMLELLVFRPGPHFLFTP